jgi:A/G-specific adenine glycosylase
VNRRIAEAVVAHYAAVKRDLPWRRTRDPYAIWVSEVMLQQTRVATVIPYWERWLAKFPTLTALAAAPLDDVLAQWAGLGYYSRARNLHAAAREVGEQLPRTAAELRAIRGIGPYTAGAIASIAYDERVPLVDGNVARVFARVFGIELDIKSTAGSKLLWARAAELMHALPETAAPGDLNQGLMELGATLCSPEQPRCLACPLARDCVAATEGRQAELPVIAPRKTVAELPLLARTLVWIEAAGKIVVGRRVPGGLFGGLWELPDVAAAERLGCALDVRVVARHHQTLTHRRLRLAVICGAMPPRLVADGDPSYDAFDRVPIAEVVKLGVAAATTAILTKYQGRPWTSTTRHSLSSPRATPRSSKASASSVTTSATRTSPTPPRGRRKGSTSSSTTRGRSSSR